MFPPTSAATTQRICQRELGHRFRRGRRALVCKIKRSFRGDEGRAPMIELVPMYLKTHGSHGVTTIQDVEMEICQVSAYWTTHDVWRNRRRHVGASVAEDNAAQHARRMAAQVQEAEDLKGEMHEFGRHRVKNRIRSVGGLAPTGETGA